MPRGSPWPRRAASRSVSCSAREYPGRKTTRERSIAWRWSSPPRSRRSSSPSPSPISRWRESRGRWPWTARPHFVSTASAAPSAAVRPVWDTAVRFASSPKDGVLSTSVSLYVDTKAKPEELKALQGVLTVQLPKTIETLRLDDLTPGSKASSDALTVTVAGRGRKSLTLEAGKDGARVL